MRGDIRTRAEVHRANCHRPATTWPDRSADIGAVRHYPQDQTPGADHPADGHLVLTVIGNDGVRWACRVCDQTVYQRDGHWLHFGETPQTTPQPTTQEPHP